MEAARALPRIAKSSGTALLVHTLYAGQRSEPLRQLREAGVPVIESLDVACACVAALVARSRLLERARSRPNPWSAERSPAPRTAPAAALTARAEQRTVLLEPEARSLLAAAGVPLIPAVHASSEREAQTAARAFGGPVAVRIVSPAAPHKTEAGGVRLDVVGDDDVAGAFRAVTSALAAWAERLGLEPDGRGVLVSPMAARPVAELLIGAARDPQFGPVLTLGAGGTAVEVTRDVSLRVLPVTAAEVRAMIDELRMAPLLAGIRGRPPVDRERIVAAALALADVFLAHDGLAEIEVNPLFVYPDHVLALDARAYLTDVGRVE
jgi:acetyltransferase